MTVGLPTSRRGWGLLWFATLTVLQVVAAAVMTQVAPISPFSAGRSQANSYLGFPAEFAVAFGLLALAIGDVLLARLYGARLGRAASRGIDWRRLRHAGDGWLTRV